MYGSSSKQREECNGLESHKVNGLSVVIPSKTASNLILCVQAVRKCDPESRILVIDDGVTWHDTVAWRTEWRMGAGFAIINGVKPFIFSRACNQGIAAAGGDDIVLCNDDALLESSGGFSRMQRFAEEHPEVGLVSATTNHAGNPEQLRRQGDNVRILKRNTPGNSFPTVAFVCVLIPRRTIDLVGLMDERFGGMTPEGKRIYGFCDGDYCRRVFNAGKLIAIADSCYVDHGKLPSSFRSVPSQPIDMEAARQIYLKKWGSM